MPPGLHTACRARWRARRAQVRGSAPGHVAGDSREVVPVAHPSPERHTSNLSLTGINMESSRLPG